MNKRITKKQKKESLILSEDYEKLFHLTDQLPHSFILEKTILSCILIHSDTSFQTLEIIMEHLPIEALNIIISVYTLPLLKCILKIVQLIL